MADEGGLNMHLARTIRKYIGWCPNADARMRKAETRTDESSSVSSGKDVPTANAVNWWSRYRNWLFFWALINIPFAFSLWTFLPMDGNYILFFIVGVATGSLVFILYAHRLWRRYDEVFERGYLEETAMNQKVVPSLVVSTVILLISFELLVFLGYIPGIDFFILPAFLIGFSIIPWFVLILVIIWESRTGNRLYLDRKGQKVSMYVFQRN